MSAEIADLLDRAADRVAVGWMQGDFMPDGAADLDTCPVCLVGGVYWAETGLPYMPDAEALVALDAVVAVLGGEVRSDADTWNDEDGRTQDEVIAVLRRAAAAERAA